VVLAFNGHESESLLHVLLVIGGKLGESVAVVVEDREHFFVISLSEVLDSSTGRYIDLLVFFDSAGVDGEFLVVVGICDGLEGQESSSVGEGEAVEFAVALAPVGEVIGSFLGFVLRDGPVLKAVVLVSIPESGVNGAASAGREELAFAAPVVGGDREGVHLALDGLEVPLVRVVVVGVDFILLLQEHVHLADLSVCNHSRGFVDLSQSGDEVASF